MTQHTQGASRTAPMRDGRALHDAELPGPDGADLPTVVFEAGLAASRSFWARQSPQGRHVVAERSGHGLILTEPDVVAAEIPRVPGRTGDG